MRSSGCSRFAALIVIIIVFSLASSNFLQFDNVVGSFSRRR